MAAPAEPGRRGRRRALTDEAFLDAALALLDGGGSDAMSLRAIATRVGVAPNAVYTYFPDKAAVVKALVERVIGEVDHGGFTDRSRPWRDRVEALAVELRQRLTVHPGVVGLMISAPLDGPNALALNEEVLELLADAGLDPADAARAHYLLMTYVFGSLVLEATEVPGPGPLPSEAERIDSRRQVFAAIPSERFPRSATVASTMASYVSTEQYVWGLHRVLDGIAGLPDAHR
jgi:TetR/AcrR family tetracycline transcriptional repressor